MEKRFFYISSDHNKVLRFWQPWDKAVNTLFLVSLNYSASFQHRESS